MIANMETHTLLEEARSRAKDILLRCVTAHGYRASAQAEGYPQIWARDSTAAFLGAAAVGDPELLAAGRASLQTMGAYQSARGLIPLNVNPDSGYVSTENAGAMDGNLWYILGHYLHFITTGDSNFLQTHWPIIDKAMMWLDYQDMNECGLLEIPEAGNWMDLLAVRYNVLYDNVLYYAAKLAHEVLAQHLDDSCTGFSVRRRRRRCARTHKPAHVGGSLLGCQSLCRTPGETKGHPPGMVHALPQRGHHLQPPVLPAMGGIPRIW